MDGPAGPTAIARPADADDPKPGGHMIEHLADGLADHMQFAAAAGARLMIEIKPQVLAGQMRRQAWPLGSHSRCLGCRRWKRGFDPRDVGVEVVEAELQLIVVEPFGTPAKLAALQLLHDEPEPFDLRLCLSEIDAFGRERSDHPLQRVYIIWQSGKIDVHESEVYADSRVSSSAKGVLSQSVAAIIPPPLVATAAPVRASRRRQSASTTAPRSALASHQVRRSTAIGTRRARAVW